MRYFVHIKDSFWLTEHQDWDTKAEHEKRKIKEEFYNKLSKMVDSKKVIVIPNDHITVTALPENFDKVTLNRSSGKVFNK